MNPNKLPFATLLGTASFFTLAASLDAQAQQVAQAEQVAQAQMAAEALPEQVLITGSLIRGTAAVGVPVTNLSAQDFNVTGALTTTDLFRTVPAAIVQAGPVATANAGNLEKAVRVQIRGLDTGTAQRELLMVDGVRVPPMTNQVAVLDASIIPSLGLDRIDVLIDGASATYGSDALTGVINIVLKRGYDGAVSQVRYSLGNGGKNRYQASQLWGRTWDGGDITLTYEWHDESPIMGNFHTQFTVDFTPWGLDNRIPIGSSVPGTISTGAPAQPAALGLFSGTNATFGTNCANCFAVPLGTGSSFNPAINAGLGPTAPFSASTPWATFSAPANSGSNGTRNVVNPYTLAWYDAAEQTNRSVGTIDQRLTKDLSFYGEGYYSDRRSQFISPPNSDPTAENSLTVAVPTWNPYYPSSAAGVCPAAGVPPVGCVPNNLRVSYTPAVENPGRVSAWQVDTRYLLGLNIALPGDWAGKLYYSRTTTQSQNTVYNDVNRNAVSAALGWTIPATAAAGTAPGFGTWTKPGTIPYLNLFCDPYAFQCNAPSTLSYISGFRQQATKFGVDEKGINFDGPLFDVPAGQVKAAVGATYTNFHFLQTFISSQTSSTLLVSPVADPREQQLWAVFTQVNVPVIGDNNSLPGLRKLDLEASWRHDQYSDFGGTSNAKAAFNWVVSNDIGLTLRGAWGQSFRAPDYAETSPTAGFRMQGWGLPANIFTNTSNVSILCDASGKPTPNSPAEKLFKAGFACGAQPGGVSLGGGSLGALQSGLRDFVNQDQRQLEPEKAVNWSAGFEFAPSTFFQGFDLQATWYQIKINGLMDTNFQLQNTLFNENGRANQIIIPSDTGCAAATNLAPTTCANFQTMVNTMLTSPRSQVVASAQTLLFWVVDLATMNRGWMKADGVDFNASYDFTTGIGAFNTGVTGTYALHQRLALVATGAVADAYDATLAPNGGLQQVGVETTPHLRYRARLGWSDGPWSITGFMDSRSHWFHNNSSPFNVNNQCQSAGSSVGGGTFPCAISNYTNIVPSFYLFDLSIGYDTADRPANQYLRNIQFQFIAQNVFDRHPAFSFRTGLRTSAWDIGPMGNGDVGGQGRFLSLIVTKTW